MRVVALVEGLQSIAAPYVYCSTETARLLLRLPADQTTYVLARCHDPASAAAVVERLRANPNVSVFTAEELSWRTRLHWMMKTKAGIALGFAAALGLLVGAVVTEPDVVRGHRRLRCASTPSSAPWAFRAGG